MASRKIEDLVSVLRDAVPKIVAEYNEKFPLRELRPICTARSQEEQWELFKVGRKADLVTRPDGTFEVRVYRVDRSKVVTWKDGYVEYSKHNTSPDRPLSRAVDFGVFVGGKYVTDPDYYLPLRDLARKHGLLSGLDFPGKWKDAPHVEVPN